MDPKVVDETIKPRSRGLGLSSWAKAPTAAPAALVVVSILASVWFLLLTRGEYFFSDEWARFSFFPNVGFEWSLHGVSGHLVLLNVLVYRALLEVFGADSYLPFRLTCLALQLSAVWLLFFYLKPRVDAWMIVACLSPLLFLGSAWVVTASAYGVVILTPIVFGLAALLLLERRSQAADLGAALFLLAATLSHSGALPFLVGALVLLSVSARSERRRAWVIAPSVVVYLGWFVWSRSLSPDLQFFDQPVLAGNAGFLGESLLQTPSAALAAASGTFYRLGEGGGLEFNLVPGYVLLALSLLGLLFLWRRRGGSLPAHALVPVAMLFVFAFLIAFGMSDPDRQPTSPRYLYFTTVCVLWTLCELGPILRWRPRWYAILAAVLGLGILANASIYGKATASLREAGIRARAGVTALEIAGTSAAPWYRLSMSVGGLGADGAFSDWTAGLDQRSIERFGADSYSPARMQAAGDTARSVVDQVLVAVEEIEPDRVPSGRGPCGPGSPATEWSPGESVQVNPGYTLVLASSETSDVPVRLAVRRFGSSPIALRPITGDGWWRLSLPGDRSLRRWTVALTPSSGRARLCLSEGVVRGPVAG